MSDFVTELNDLFDVAPEAAFTAESKPGDSVSGFVETMKLAPVFDPETRRPAKWEDGRPQKQLVLVLESEGKFRTVYIKTWGVQRKALAKAVEEAGGRSIGDVLAEGSEFTATYTGDEKSTVKGYNDTKLFEYKIG